MEFFLPYGSLPSNSHIRRQMLDDYFPSDLIPFDELIDNAWRIRAFIPNDPAFYVDPNFQNALARWHERVEIEEIGCYWRIYKNSMLSFNDSWSLLYWSLVLDWMKNASTSASQITLLHVDDHVDQGPPLLTMGSEGFECIFSGKEVNFKDPSSIEAACMQKSVNIRSFITPFLHALDAIDVLHLRYAHKGPLNEKYLKCTTEEDVILASGKQRPSIKMTPDAGEHRYSIASTPSPLVDRIKKDSILFLHLDCDALNNRYNGDSNWDRIPPTIDEHLPQMKERISELFFEIGRLNATVFLNVALSPGFFPSEYWQAMLEHIFNTASLHGLIREDGLSDYLKNLYPERVLHEAFC